MNIIVETWESDARWRNLNGVAYEIADGKLWPVDQNPLFLFNQNASMGLVVEMWFRPNDDFQLSLVQPVSSIGFTDQGAITYFGILYEKQFGDYAQQFVLLHRSEWGPLLSNSAPSPALPHSTVYRMLFSASGNTVRIKVFSEAGDLLWEITQSDVLVGDMAFLINPGRLYSGGLQPWIGQTKFIWGASQEFVDAFMDSGDIQVPGLKAPVVTSQPVFREGIYSSWRSPAFEGSGALSLEVISSLPAGLSIGMQGSEIVIFGLPLSGTAGEYPVTVRVSDGFSSVTITMTLQLQVLSSWERDSGSVPDAAVAMGDYYYQIAGGPVRKEFHVNN